MKDLINYLKDNDLKIAFAESMTGGLLTNLLTDQSGASKVFELGVIAYSKDAKETVLNISNKDMTNFGVVSKEIAQLMAISIQKLAKSDLGIGLTGNAGPLVQNGLVGEFYFSIIFKQKLFNYHFIAENKTRIEVKKEASKEVFKAIKEVLGIL